MQRRLASVLIMDVVGYSRLMERDETATLEMLQNLREDIINPSVRRNNGRQVKLMGDGALLEFASAVDAVSCAVDIQTAIAPAARSLPDERQLLFRIGIHVGDVVVDEDDIYGDAVNIAARLEALAKPGGICVSQQAYDHVEHRMDLPFADMGLVQVKNVVRPLHVWSWSPDAAAGDGGISAKQVAPLPRKNERGSAGERPSIVVLPFKNLSPDQQQEYFADGVSEDVITSLSRCRWLRVIARNTAFAYKDKTLDVRQISEELSVRYVLDGSVRRSTDRVRVSVQLMDGRDGTNLWSERYEGTLDDFLRLQDEIAGAIAGTLEPELSAIEGAALHSRSTSDLNAWDSYQRGLWHLYHFSIEELKTAKELFERAIALDPAFAQAHAQLAYCHIQLGFYGAWEERPDRMRDAIAFAKRALLLDSREPAARISLGRALALSGDREAGLAEARTAVELDENHAQARFALGQILCFLQRPEEAIKQLDEAIRLSPRDPHIWTFIHVRALAYYMLGDLETAEAEERSALRQHNATFWPAMVLLAILGRRQKGSEAADVLRLVLQQRPGFTCAKARKEFYFGERPYMSESYISGLIGDLAAAGLPA